METEKISVIIPVYNRVDFAIESVQSVIDQTHKNWELILVDDGSTADLTPLVELVATDTRISLVHQQNEGPAAARNHGLRLATGTYIAFLDSDDLFVREKLATQLKYLQKTGHRISHTSYSRMNIEGQFQKTIHSGTLQGNVIPQILSFCPVATPTVMGHTSVFKSNTFPVTFKIGEDVCLWIQLASQYEFGGIDTALTQVRYVETSAANSNTKQAEGLINICSFLIHDPVLSQHQSHIKNLLLQAAHVIDTDTRNSSIWKKMLKLFKAC